jgi:hypothetical protein
MRSRGLECFRQSWNTIVHGSNAFYSVGMLSTELEYLCTGLECFLQCWNTFVQSWNALYRVEMLYTGLECFPDGWIAF